jgi:hypothetical protein
MNLEEHIRQHIIAEIIKPARIAGEETIHIQVAQVSARMGLLSNEAEIVRTMSNPEFDRLAGVRLVQRRGPHMGANLIFFFEIKSPVDRNGEK